MSEHDNELLSQYLDGELGAPQLQELEHRLTVEPALQASLEQLKSVDNALRNAFDVPGADTVPTHIAAMLERPASNVVAFPSQRKARWSFAVAASLLAASGLLFFEDNQSGLKSGMPADDLLAYELEHASSRAEGWDLLADGRQVRPILSFHSRSDGWCREYMLAEQGDQWHGIACRGENRWINTVVTPDSPSLPGASSEYRPAGANDADKIRAYIDAEADDIALGFKAEAELINNSWD